MLMIHEYTSWEGGLRYIRGRLEELEIARDIGRLRKKINDSDKENIMSD
jgi:hypothetical protein